MSVDLKDLQLKLAEQKVYDAWQYVESLCKYIKYMRISQDLVIEIDKRRKEILSRRLDIEKQKAKNNGTNVIREFSKNTYIFIDNLQINDNLLQEKNILDFFHYARISIDILFQILNAAILNDDAINATDTKLICKFKNKLNSLNDPTYSNISKKINNILQEFEYIISTDNYVKHIKSIEILLSYNIFDYYDTTFKIEKFNYKSKSYESVDVISEIQDTYKKIYNFVEDVLSELITILPYCKMSDLRVQSINVEIQKISGNDIATFFIDTDSPLIISKDKIKVFPVSIKKNGYIYSSNINAKKIFIRLKEDNTIIGYAVQDENDNIENSYRSYKVFKGDVTYYENYLNSEESKSAILNFNILAAENKIS